MKCDFLVIGGGIAGASIAYELAGRGVSVILAEREAQTGFHTTGRSAATYLQSYGNFAVCTLTTASRDFFDNPPEGFCDYPLLSPRGALFTSDSNPEDIKQLEQELKDDAETGYLEQVDLEKVKQLCPPLKEENVVMAAYEQGAMDIDVNALLMGYLSGFRKREGSVVVNAEVEAFSRQGDKWHVTTRAGTIEAGAVVNASGAWADVVAEMAGTHKVGLVPKRRTVVTFDPGHDVSKLTLTGDMSENWYFRPEGGELMISPADETPSEPCDAQPEELDIAIIIDRIETVTQMKVRKVSSSRAGLRSFVSDHSPVIGYAEDVECFFWMAGQGGYGIQMAPALAKFAAALAVDRVIPDFAREWGLELDMVLPTRLPEYL